MQALLYESVGKADGWTTFLNALALSYGGGKASLAVQAAPSQPILITASGQWEPKQIKLFNQYYSNINPWVKRVGEAAPRLTRISDPTGLVRTSEQVLPRADLFKTESYTDFLRPVLNVEQGIAVNIDKENTRRASITILFPPAKRSFDPTGRLQRLVPHIVRFGQLNRQLAGLEARAAAAEAMLDGLEMALIVVNAAEQVVYMNAAAQRIIMAGDGPKLSRSILDAATPAEGKALRHLVALALRAPRNINASPGGVMRISRRSGFAPYEVLVTPISAPTLGFGFDGPMAAVFLRDPNTRIVTSTDRLQQLYALTGAEARLMQALLAGDSLDTISDRFGVTRETLRSQLKAVFLKTGTSSQIALIRLGLRGLAAFKN